MPLPAVEASRKRLRVVRPASLAAPLAGTLLSSLTIPMSTVKTLMCRGQAVIGAGAAGLVTARELIREVAPALLLQLDKLRSIGCTLSTAGLST